MWETTCSEARGSPVGTGSPEKTPRTTHMRSHIFKFHRGPAYACASPECSLTTTAACCAGAVSCAGSRRAIGTLVVCVWILASPLGLTRGSRHKQSAAHLAVAIVCRQADEDRFTTMQRRKPPTRTAKPSSSSPRCPPAPASPAPHRRRAAPAAPSAGNCAPDRRPEPTCPDQPVA